MDCKKSWEEYTIAEVIEHKKNVCAKCYYFCVHKSYKCTNWTDSTCDYLKINKKARLCMPTECVELGFFKPKGKKRRRAKSIKL